MPLLEYLDVNVIHIGEGAEGLRNISLRSQAQQGLDPSYTERLPHIEMDMEAIRDRRTTIDEMDDGWTGQATLFEDVRNYTLHQWQERVYHRRAGPWKDPQTSFVRPQAVSGVNADGSWTLSTPFAYAPDADFSINKPDFEDVMRQYDLAYLRRGEPLDPQAREALHELVRKGKAH